MLAEQEVDIAVVAGVYTERADAVVAALAHWAHVLADKPLCTSTEQLDRIADAAATAHRHVSVMFEKRFHPVTVAAKRLVADGKLPAEYFFDALLAGHDPEITTAASLLATRVALTAQASAEADGAALSWSAPHAG